MRKLLKLLSHTLLFLIFLAMYMLNMARFYFGNDTEFEKFVVGDYLAKNRVTTENLDVILTQGYPERLPQKFADLFGGQVIWEYYWKSENNNEKADGTLSVFSTGKYAMSGDSSVQGELGTDEW